MKLNISKARKKLSRLIRAVENAASVTICRRGVPIVDLVWTDKSAGQMPKFGTLRGRIVINDPDCWKPLSDEEAQAFLEGR
jgi:antitoxin (DNA-binding transcriptional repressor) of toxin-antitoxin stability system